jgi:fumarylacetoacetate (FAA) hydrolase
VLDDWNFLSPQLQDLYDTLNHGKARHAFPFDPASAWRRCRAPTSGPTARRISTTWSWCARRAIPKVPASFYTDPLMYQGGSDDFIGP